jgi:hypothetical protein
MSPQLRDSRGNLIEPKTKGPKWLQIAASGKSPELNKEFDWS